ncbi:MAG: hypothetical protein GXO54_02470, partial [Chloroflexi bacterium]|nr:hypothetical protein [Chloroflexota bacterium]
RAFERHGFCTFAFDLPHHGERRAHPGPLSARGQYEAVQKGAEDIIQAAQWLRVQGAREVYLVARSLGSIAAAVALGRGAAIERAELLLAGADLPSILEAQGRVPGPRQRAALRAIDPLTYLPRYTGRLHIHCAREDRTIPPHACQAAYEAATRAQERRLIWHPGGHAMPLTAYFNDALAFFTAGLPSTPTPVP